MSIYHKDVRSFTFYQQFLICHKTVLDANVMQDRSDSRQELEEQDWRTTYRILMFLQFREIFYLNDDFGDRERLTDVSIII